MEAKGDRREGQLEFAKDGCNSLERDQHVDRDRYLRLQPFEQAAHLGAQPVNLIGDAARFGQHRLARLGAARVGRLLEGDRGMIVIDVLVPGPRYRELIEGLGQIGRWVTEYESGTLPAQVRVEVALTVEP